jgi:hypothetical protein
VITDSGIGEENILVGSAADLDRLLGDGLFAFGNNALAFVGDMADVSFHGYQ